MIDSTIEKVLLEMITYFNSDARRINHSLKVHNFCRIMCTLEQLEEKQQLAVNLSGILHDIGIKEAERKYNSSAGTYQEKEGPPIAREIMEKYDIDSEIVERVCYIVGNHHSYSKLDGIDFQILVEADFLVNIYEDQMDKTTAASIRSKYFKTGTGIRIFENMY